MGSSRLMRRKFFSVARNDAAAQRATMAVSRQRHTRRVRMRTPDCGLSIKFVVVIAVSRNTRCLREASGKLMILALRMARP